MIDTLSNMLTGFGLLLFPFALGFIIFRLIFVRARIDLKGGRLVVTKDQRRLVAAALFCYEGFVFSLLGLPLPGLIWWIFQVALTIPAIGFRKAFMLHEIIADRSARTIVLERRSLQKTERFTIAMTGSNSITAEPVEHWAGEQTGDYSIHVSNNSPMTDLLTTSHKEAFRIVEALNKYFDGDE